MIQNTQRRWPKPLCWRLMPTWLANASPCLLGEARQKMWPHALHLPSCRAGLCRWTLVLAEHNGCLTTVFGGAGVSQCLIFQSRWNHLGYSQGRDTSHSPHILEKDGLGKGLLKPTLPNCSWGKLFSPVIRHSDYVSWVTHGPYAAHQQQRPLEAR